MAVWRTTIPAEAICNANISLQSCPFNLTPYTGGTNESERPEKTLTVHFENSHTAKEMWIYGEGPNGAAKHILTNNGRSDIKSFFDRNGISGSCPIDLEIEELSPGELAIRKA